MLNIWRDLLAYARARLEKNVERLNSEASPEPYTASDNQKNFELRLDPFLCIKCRGKGVLFVCNEEVAPNAQLLTHCDCPKGQAQKEQSPLIGGFLYYQIRPITKWP